MKAGKTAVPLTIPTNFTLIENQTGFLYTVCSVMIITGKVVYI